MLCCSTGPPPSASPTTRMDTSLETLEPLGATAEVPAWLVAALPWLAVILVLLLFATALAAWMLVAHARGLERLGKRLDALEELKILVKGISAERQDIDLRRLEHVVVDIRDAQRRTEDVLLRALEKATHDAEVKRNGSAPGDPGPTVGERVVNRLLALGYERVQIVSPLDDLTRLAGADGEVLIEAHRQGVLHKGRVTLRGGALSDVELSPAYSIFP